MNSKIFISIFILFTIRGLACRLLIDSRDSKIVNGEISNRRNERHFVSIRLKSKEDRLGFGHGHFCGGSLIRNNIVLTAAHCLEQEFFGMYYPFLPRHLTIVLGTIFRKFQQPSTVVRSVVKMVAHPDFNRVSVLNDIGLILLNETAVTPENANVDVIQLSDKSPDVDTECRVSGFGHTAYKGELSNFLMTAHVPILNATVCNGTDSYNGAILDKMLCAGYMNGQKDSCNGDSGGPLVCSSILTGVVSWGEKCAFQNFPGIYSDVSKFRDWIDENVNALLAPTTTTSSTTSTTTSKPAESESTPTVSSSTTTLTPLPTMSSVITSTAQSSTVAITSNLTSTTVLSTTVHEIDSSSSTPITERPINSSTRNTYANLLWFLIFSVLSLPHLKVML